MKMRKKNDTAVYSTGTKVIRFLVVLLMSFVAFLTLYPIFYVVLGAFKKNQELLTGGINIFPSEWIVQNFIDAWNSANFAVYTGNSIFLALSVMILTLVVTSMAGYVFARKNFRGKELIYGLFVAFMFVNVGSVTLRPLFELAVKIHMNTSLWSVVFISAGTAQATYIFRRLERIYPSAGIYNDGCLKASPDSRGDHVKECGRWCSSMEYHVCRGDHRDRSDSGHLHFCK